MLSTRQGIISAFIGTTISLFNAIIQFLTMYWILQKFGAEFNGFVRLVSSFSALISTSESALGIAATILLIKPIVRNDWISANEIYSTTKKSFRRAAMTDMILVISLCIVYPFYAGVSASGTLFEPNSWKDLGINLVDGTKATYWELAIIAFLFGFKNFITCYFFSVYETIIAADNKNSVRRIIILFIDVLTNGIFFYLLSIGGIKPFITFLPILLYAPIKGLLIYFYSRKKYLWLKFYNDFNSFKLVSTKKKISFSTLGTTILINTDIIIASIILGLQVSSALSLYLVVAVNTRLIMTNFIISFREFFVVLVTKRGRINWESYIKYELYTYLIAGFTFINMSILSPYFVSSLYGNLVENSLKTSVNMMANLKALNFMFYSPYFSLIYGAITSLIIMADAQMTLIQAKGRYSEVSRFQNILGLTYILVVPLITFILISTKAGGLNYLVSGILAMYILKLIFSVIRYSYLWIYVYKYVTYNSRREKILSNFLVLVLPCVLMTIFNLLILNNKFSIYENTGYYSSSLNILGLFFGSIVVSIIVLILFAYIFNPIVMNGIFKNLPLINRILSAKVRAERKKRLDEYGVKVEDIVDNSSRISQVMLDVQENVTINDLALVDENLEDDAKTQNIYIIKGK
ncbi:hypothetical protein [Spiroplasma turonicum]|uniref:Transmembrane protein n=1 Tax=Spiroplasma turonicum TaxID=216946 RepID=A0A0K1P5A5_9MOLU|nr:hypothetical protein [Spiroplasma turonicum]AKU79354.1 hypothetical protein STURON_00108 [Spiroplasma turonicum]ALX70375.1 hypothetical protein STURO_v1c01060 [Spiroplasma turonicum]